MHGESTMGVLYSPKSDRLKSPISLRCSSSDVLTFGFEPEKVVMISSSG